MISALPDVNVWIALAYREHPHHLPAIAWFANLTPNDVLFFSRATQESFLRLLTQSKVMGSRVLTQREAWRTYDLVIADARILLMPEPRGFESLFRMHSDRDEVSPKRWPDDHLLAFAEAAGVTLVTFDDVLAARSRDSLLLRG